MQLHNPYADVFVPDESDLPEALSRVTHLAIGAHQDDLEIFAYHGIEQCYQKKDRWFGGVVVTNGSGSARTGPYGHYTDEEMMQVRLTEQRKAASVGDYAVQLQLSYTSAEVKDPQETASVDDLEALLRATQPEVLYLHNPADKHPTHIGTLKKTLAALRRLPREMRPMQTYGCEVWRDLDWVDDAKKVALPTDRREHLAAALLGVFDSQIAGGKRYDLGTMGRRFANATYFQSHATDEASAITFALDLNPLVNDDQMTLPKFIEPYLDEFKRSVMDALK